MRNVSVNVSGPIQASSTYKTIVLKGNLPFAAQLAGEDIKYVIKYNFNLGGETVAIPKNCILEFDGGSLNNGTVLCSNTILEGNKRGNAVFTGTYSDRTLDTLKSDTESLKEKVGEGRTVDERIADAVSTLKGNASQDYDTLGKLEGKLKDEVSEREYQCEEIKDDIHDLEGALSDETARAIAAEQDRYTKSEVNNIVSRSPETDVIVIDVPTEYQSDIAAYLDANTPSGTDPETGRSVRANKLYRVPGPSNTTFSEWAWDGTAYIPLANKDYGIDDEPTPGSDNMTKSGGIVKMYGKYINNNKNIVDCFADPKGRILLAFYKDGSSFISGVNISVIKDFLNRIDILVDKTGKIVSYRKKDGTLVENKASIKHAYIEELDLGEEAVNSLVDMLGGSSGEALTDPDGWDIPKTELDEIAIRKADSMALIKWTPKKNYPKRETSSPYNVVYFPQGEEVTGIPYGATYEKNKCVGFDVSLETFMTAVNNPYSLVYTEFCSRKNSQSAWGIVYHGINHYAGPYYANVCSEFTSYCLGLSAKYLTRFYPWFNDIHSMGRSCPQDAQGARPGDILYNSGHCALVKSVKRTDSGRVTEVVISEQANDNAYETLYTAADLNTRIENNECTIYRDVRLKRNARMFEFDAYNYVYNNDICTFAGDKACFREGEMIVINYNLDGTPSRAWAAIELYKNDILFRTYRLSEISQAELPEGQRNHALKLSGGLESGHYKARLVDGIHYSGYTEFDVIQTSVSVLDGTLADDHINISDTLHVSFVSNNGTPMSLKLTYDNDSRLGGVYVFTDEDIEKGEAAIPVSLFIQQDKETEKFSKDIIYGVAVFFSTDYGQVTNESIKIKFNY